MPHAYIEDQLVEQPAKASGPPSTWPSPSGRGNDGLFADYSAGPNPRPRPFSHCEKGGRQAGLRVRSLVLASRLRAALERLNPALPPEAIAIALDELTRELLLPLLLSGQVSLSAAREVVSFSPHTNKS